ncbi:phosphoadenylyl-sulfate reductase [Aeribacillus pallidus]|uniref:phosphoadenylyl-sulfate reductase n=1 Tax=Aeribacillus pallidus TaxID=33936 RepID=UPI003D21A151
MGSTLTYDRWDQDYVQQLQNGFKDFVDVIKWAYKEYEEKMIYACSFGAEGVVLVDIISKINPFAKIIFLDTDLHFNETYELIDRIKEKYPTLKIEMIKSDISVNQQNANYGDRLWEKNPNLCCYLRKIQPLKKVLTNHDAWMTGLRREQSSTRKNINYINKDDKFEKIKICPLIDWSWEDVWSYIRIHQIPYNQLHDQHYPSIGCEPCTAKVLEGTNLRAGRWINKEKTECGLHK